MQGGGNIIPGKAGAFPYSWTASPISLRKKKKKEQPLFSRLE